MKFRFEDFEIWQASRKFVSQIYRVTKNFPVDEKFGLIDQLRRASVSISLNIAEGSDRRSDVEFRRYLRMAISSIDEVISGLYIALDLNYLSHIEFKELYEDSHMIAAKINAFIKQLSSGGQQ